jgi:hypothetical protein
MRKLKGLFMNVCECKSLLSALKLVPRWDKCISALEDYTEK